MDYHISRETEDIRDAFLIAEFDYIEKLTKIPGFGLYYKKYKELGVETLSKNILTLHQMMEEGKIEKKQEEKVELQMICSCLAIEDKIRELIITRRNQLDESTKQR